MELLVAADSLFLKTPDGKYWCKTIYEYDFWLRYLKVFEKVAVVSRVKSAELSEVDGYLRVDGPNLRVVELPSMSGMKQYILNYYLFSKAAKEAVENADCALFRLPSVAASMVLKYYARKKKPYALEIVADPFDAYSSNKIAQLMYTKKLKESAISANGVSYVTQFYLQSKYPSFASKYGETIEHFESYYSTINLPSSYLTKPRIYGNTKKHFTIVHTANSINNDIKGHETLLKVLKNLREKHYDINIIFIGDGSKRKFYEQMSKNMGIEEYVTFTGLLSTQQEVRDILLQSDIFVFPTKAEGLPRAVIEAMAVGLPCLSTPVNGIPELLDEEYLFNPLDVEGFTSKIIHLIDSPDELEEMSKKNIKKAKMYTIDKLELRRTEFYVKLKKLSIK
ncbi:glycosyltransferase family 4 protein [Solibacillus isronensis]|uniref:glycosyltransferase family 4 protein n=1 Tax=Solibacillus isronensis TaxID=412383 RepID=UPI0009A728C3|nr:glycosyltransferase family 4 protein [Solibacillus isronensis]